jgi:two-component system, LytTR family, sensor kinase
LFVFGLSTSFKTVSEYLKNEKKQSHAEKEKLNSELSFLKSQVSPHFLFNTLNNLYTLASVNSKDTAPAIMKLSEMMRYMIYESEDEKVWLSKEIEYLESYVELQKLRVPPDVDINFTIESDNERKLIAPMLLVPFIENAFKHGISYRHGSFIDIKIKAWDNFISIKVKNSVNTNADKDKTSGIGLQNVKRRLELLYPNKYRLELRQSDTEFYIDLRIDISKVE